MSRRYMSMRSPTAYRLIRTAGILAAVFASAYSGRPGERQSMLRVAFLPQSSPSSLPCSGCVKLGTLPEGTWEAVPDDVFLSGLAAKPPGKLLYFSKQEYEAAIHGLSAREVVRVIRKRLGEWSENAINDAQDRVYRLQTHCLSLTAGSWHAESGPEKRNKLEEHFADGLQLLADLVGQGRYEGMSLQQILALALRQEARVLAELSEISKDSPIRQQSGTAIGAMTATARNRAAILQSALRETGNREFAGSLPHIRLERVLFIEPRDKELQRLLVARGVDFLEWRKGLVAPWPLDGVQELRKSGRSVAILYMNGGDFSADLASLTSAQLERECAERAEPGSSDARTVNHLRALRLEQHLLLRNVAALAKTGTGGETAALAGLAAEDSAAMLQEMAVAVNGRGVPGDHLPALALAESELLREAMFFRQWAGSQERKELEQRFAEIVRRKLRDQERISALMNPKDQTQ
ncbi:MAG: hypothetical protein H6Q05_1894 [Acidobacteria bacterium]|nr:hypothetical protein [Acidobacteriota bacterium]